MYTMSYLNKEEITMLKLQGLNKAIGDYHRANSGGPYSPRYGRLMLDKSTGEIWTDEFYDLGHNRFKSYESYDIINLGAIMKDDGYEITRDAVKDFCFERYNILSKYIACQYEVLTFLLNGDIIHYVDIDYKKALKEYNDRKQYCQDAIRIELRKATLKGKLIKTLFTTYR